MSDMVAGWVVSVSLFLVCGCIARFLMKIVNDLDRATSVADEGEGEHPPHDDQPGLVLADDIAIPTALARAVESRKVHEPLVSVDATHHIDGGLDVCSSARNGNEGETSPDCGAGPDIPDALGRDGSPARRG
jgi:hypothetical protein